MPDRAVVIGAHLSPEEEKELVQFLNKNKDVFAWSAKNKVLVNWAKNLSPSKRRSCRIREYIREYALRREICFRGKEHSRRHSDDFA
jgi:hypothetical protein